ncbi:hypothetical protein Sarmat_00893 [Rickettsiales endosymbiont of Paramecium tredecaurelia]|nr:hypothetical protein [Candidatus Sarmatiella mevalonica]
MQILQNPQFPAIVLQNPPSPRTREHLQSIAEGKKA